MEIAIIAHDGKKETLIEFLQEYRGFFSSPDVHLVATGNTGSLAEKGGFAVEKLLSGPLGGDAQIATRVAEGMTDMVLFFRDPLDKTPPRTRHCNINSFVRCAQCTARNESSNGYIVG